MPTVVVAASWPSTETQKSVSGTSQVSDLKPKACILDYFKKLQSFSVQRWRHPKNFVFLSSSKGDEFSVGWKCRKNDVELNDVNPHTYRWASISLSEEMLNYERYHRHTDDNINLVDITTVENIRNASKCVIVFFWRSLESVGDCIAVGSEGEKRRGQWTDSEGYSIPSIYVYFLLLRVGISTSNTQREEPRRRWAVFLFYFTNRPWRRRLPRTSQKQQTKEKTCGGGAKVVSTDGVIRVQPAAFRGKEEEKDVEELLNSLPPFNLFPAKGVTKCVPQTNRPKSIRSKHSFPDLWFRTIYIRHNEIWEKKNEICIIQ